jgi:serine/threonine-protein phosphatase PP1 catalytic subunit
MRRMLSAAATSRCRETFNFIISNIPSVPNLTERLTPEFVLWLLQSVEPILEREPNLIPLASPINICGDLHGQLDDLNSILRLAGLPPDSRYLFLGDYVDRGKHSVEVVCLLFCLKLDSPDHVYLLRGNHECRYMTREYGFEEECRAKLNKPLYQSFCQVFDQLPIAAVIDGSIFCVHGGLSKEIKTLAQINQLHRAEEIPDIGALSDLVWSDPDPSVRGWKPSDRCATFLWGFNVSQRFLEHNDLVMIVRAHEVVPQGYQFPFAPDKSVVTVFSATNADEMGDPNKASYMTVNNNATMTFTVLPDPVALKRAAQSRAAAKKVASELETAADSRPETPRRKSRQGAQTAVRDSVKRKR